MTGPQCFGPIPHQPPPPPDPHSRFLKLCSGWEEAGKEGQVSWELLPPGYSSAISLVQPCQACSRSPTGASKFQTSKS